MEQMDELVKKLEHDFEIMTPKSRLAYDSRATKCMPGGVASSYHEGVGQSYPVYLKRADGGRVWDIDGNEFSDFHLNYGSVLVGHKNPDVLDGIKRVLGTEGPGLLLGASTELNMDVAELLAKRYGNGRLPYWRFMNSGTEATRDAIQLARGFTGREYIIKIEGGYHGVHESVSVSYHPSLEEAGDPQAPSSVPFGKGEPSAIASLTLAIPFNCDASVLQNCIGRVNGQVACLIMEPIMLNCGMIVPRPGFLQMVREICTKHDILLIFDEVKTNSAVGPGGATGLYGVIPDMITLGKSIGGGVPLSALGMNEKIAKSIADGRLSTVGTFSGNPLAMATAQASLMHVFTDNNYQEIDRLQKRLVDSLRSIIRDAHLNALVVTIGAKGYIQFFAGNDDDDGDGDRYRFGYKDYRAYLHHEKQQQLQQQQRSQGKSSSSSSTGYDVQKVLWYYLFLNGVRTVKGEEWTISPMHTDDDIDRFIRAFRVFARDWPFNKLAQALPINPT